MKTTAAHLKVGLALAAALAASPAVLQAKELTEEFHQTYPLSAEGRVELGNVNGRVQIAAWDRPEVQVEAVKRAARQAQLDEVKIEIQAKPDRISIETRYPTSKRGRSNSARVDYVLKVPRQARLDKVSNVNGEIAIEGVRGRIEASTVNGALSAQGLIRDTTLSSVNGTVSATFERLDGVRSASVKTVNGRVAITLPEGADADLRAQSLNGSIQTDFDVTVKHHWPIGHDLKAKVGKGGAEIQAETVNGSIHIARGPSAELR